MQMTGSTGDGKSAVGTPEGRSRKKNKIICVVCT